MFHIPFSMLDMIGINDLIMSSGHIGSSESLSAKLDIKILVNGYRSGSISSRIFPRLFLKCSTSSCMLTLYHCANYCVSALCENLLLELGLSNPTLSG